MATFLGLYWFYRTPRNPIESIMAVSFCMVTAWLGKKFIEWMVPR